MATIDVLIAIDSETILSTLPHGSVDNPTQVPNSPDLIFMVTKQAEALSGQAGNELNISAETDDTVRWRATTLSLNSDSEVILYKFIATSGAGLISNPEPLLATIKAPLPNPNNPTSPGTQEIKSYFYNSVVTTPGSVTYQFHFLIIDRHGTIQGYYHWDPFITINA